MPEEPEVAVAVAVAPEEPEAPAEAPATAIAEQTADVINHDRLLAIEGRLGEIAAAVGGLAGLLAAKADVGHTHAEYVTHGEAQAIAEDVVPEEEPSETVEIEPPEVPADIETAEERREPARIEGIW